ncbi:MAG: DUF4342 domain-containing protein [Armatimonadetes bacterium]|nr:DUF4342 domain-containing protein [Armatimonadota bacterium]
MDENKRTEEFKVDGADLMGKLKELIHEGNVTRVVVKTREGKTLLDMPLVVGAVGALLLPFWAAVAAVVGLANEYSLTVERAEEPAQPKAE